MRFYPETVMYFKDGVLVIFSLPFSKEDFTYEETCTLYIDKNTRKGEIQTSLFSIPVDLINIETLSNSKRPVILIAVKFEGSKQAEIVYSVPVELNMLIDIKALQLIDQMV